jgi:hypothetical protein
MMATNGTSYTGLRYHVQLFNGWRRQLAGLGNKKGAMF